MKALAVIAPLKNNPASLLAGKLGKKIKMRKIAAGP